MKKTGILLLILLLAIALPAMAKTPAGMTIEDDVLVRYEGTAESVEVPDGVEEIAAYAFYGNQNLKAVSLPDSVEMIGECAFGNCRALETAQLGAGLTYIDHSAFYNCRALQTPVLPSGLLYIGNEAFAYCSSINGIVVPEGVTHIGDRVLASCAALEVCTMPGSLTSYGVDLTAGSPCRYVVVTSNENVRSMFELAGYTVGTPEQIDKAIATAEGRVQLRPDLKEPYDLWILEANASHQMCSSDSSVIYYGFMSVDIDDTTAWQFKTNAAHSLYDIFLEINLRSPGAVNGLRIKAGHWGQNRAGDQLYRLKGRPTRVELSFCYEGSNEFVDPVVLNIPDKKEYHLLTFDWKMNVSKMRMRIMKVETGSQYSRDIAVSEIRAVGLDMTDVPQEIIPD